MIEIELPEKDNQIENSEPTYLIIFSHPKVGKTEMCMRLPNSLLIDTEGGSGTFKGKSLIVPKLAVKHGTNQTKMIRDIIPANIQKANFAAKGFKYDFIILDNTTKLDELARPLATAIYKSTNIGKNFAGTDVISQLGDGNGWEYYRQALWSLIKPYEGLAGKCLIILCHVKDSSILKKGEAVKARDINVSGKVKMILSGRVDGTGILYRGEDNNNFLSFKTEATDTITGIRQPYLSGKEFLISHKDPDQEIITYWEKIFPSILMQK